MILTSLCQNYLRIGFIYSFLGWVELEHLVGKMAQLVVGVLYC
jgi:hypothetical protein